MSASRSKERPDAAPSDFPKFQTILREVLSRIGSPGSPVILVLNYENRPVKMFIDQGRGVLGFAIFEDTAETISIPLSDDFNAMGSLELVEASYCDIYDFNGGVLRVSCGIYGRDRQGKAQGVLHSSPRFAAAEIARTLRAGDYQVQSPQERVVDQARQGVKFTILERFTDEDVEAIQLFRRRAAS